MIDRIDAHALSGLIGSIYDCALNPDKWDRTLVEVHDALDGANAVLSLSDLVGNRILISKVVGIEPHWQQRIAAHSAEINRRMFTVLASWQDLDLPYIISRHASAADVASSAYFQECYRGQGLIDAQQYFLMHTPGRFSGFAVGRHEQRGVVTEREVALGALLLPHIRRAVTISNVLDAQAVEHAFMSEALDALRCGVVLAGETGMIVRANRAAEEMLRQGTAISGSGGVLRARAAAANEELTSAIRLAARDEAGIGKAGLAVRLDQPGGSPRIAHVLPMSGSQMRAGIQPAAIAAVFIARPEGIDDGAATLAAAYGLTPAETDVLASLLAGRTREETAAHLEISLATTKTHLISIFAKTGVRRQAELMRLAARVVPPTSGLP